VSEMFDFTDQVVIATGASGSLGRAVAEAFLAAGARLALPDRSSDRLAKLYPDLAGSDRHYLAAGIDVTEPADANLLVQETLGRLGQVDVLAHTVGGYQAGAAPHETSLETWDAMLNLNGRATFVINRAVVPAMLARGRGKIINTAARSALAGGANEVAYSVSKSAVARITESMAAAYKSRGINVNAVLPGTIDTPQNRTAMPNADHSRWVKPEALAQIILFLASEAASPIHGALIPAYGFS
jgi:NAD(P)-dependent dehydrogenase (short-subunit alcohol dehydrogenase family)